MHLMTIWWRSLNYIARSEYLIIAIYCSSGNNNNTRCTGCRFAKLHNNRIGHDTLCFASGYFIALFGWFKILVRWLNKISWPLEFLPALFQPCLFSSSILGHCCEALFYISLFSAYLMWWRCDHFHLDCIFILANGGILQNQKRMGIAVTHWRVFSLYFNYLLNKLKEDVELYSNEPRE